MFLQSSNLVKRKKLTNNEDSKIKEQQVLVVSKDVKKSAHKKLEVKLSPSLLTRAIEGLSIAQKEWVTSTGFGSLLHFNLLKYPTHIGYCIVNNFDASSSTLVVDDQKFKMTEDDVNRIMGFPRGQLEICFKEDETLKQDWRKQFGGSTDLARVSVSTLVDKIIETKVVDRNFKLNFFIVVVSILIHGPYNSYVRQGLLGVQCNLDHFYKYNWCKYVLDSFRESPAVLSGEKQVRAYSGSLAVLMVSSSVLICFFHINVI